MLDAAVFCRGLVGEGTAYAFLADHRDELSKEEGFADMFPMGRVVGQYRRCLSLGDGASST